MPAGNKSEPCWHENKAGLTLVEVMIASGLLVMGLAAFLTAFTVSRRSAVMAMLEMRATHTARQAIENLSACTYQDPKLNLGTRSLANIAMSNSYTVVQNGTYPLTKDVQVTVYWKVPGMNKQHSLSMSTSLSSCLHRGGL